MLIRPYPKAMQKILQGAIHFETDTIKALVLNASHTFNGAHEYLSDISANEVAGSTRQTLTITSGVDTTNLFGYVVPSAAIVFPAMTGTVAYLVIIKDTGNNATSPVLLCIDLETSYVLTAKKFKVNFTGNLMEIG